MDNKIYDNIIDNMMSFLPLFRGAIAKVCEKDKNIIFHSQYPILGILNKRGPLPMSEIGGLLGISKPHMTIIVDKLIEEGKVSRLDDKDDRRIVKIELTAKGRKSIGESKEIIKEEFKRRLSSLSTSDIEKLSTSLENVKLIISKINLNHEERKI